MLGGGVNPGAVRSAPKPPSGGDQAMGLLALLGDPERSREAHAFLGELKAATAENETATIKARAALAEARDAIAASEAGERDLAAGRASLAQETTEAKRRANAERDELAKERVELGQWSDDLRAREAACGKLADRLKRAADALAEWREGAKS